MHDFLTGPADETPAQTLTRWRRGIKALTFARLGGLMLTPEEESWLEFVQEKIADWESDYEVTP